MKRRERREPRRIGAEEEKTHIIAGHDSLAAILDHFEPPAAIVLAHLTQRDRLAYDQRMLVFCFRRPVVQSLGYHWRKEKKKLVYG
jgi:hypothetical protein